MAVDSAFLDVFRLRKYILTKDKLLDEVRIKEKVGQTKLTNNLF